MGDPVHFRDSVYDYVEVPRQYCDLLLDTPLVQRLRRIRQCSLEPLFPCANHHRFSHSLGVFHLAQLALQSLDRILTSKKITPQGKTIVDCSFRAACLLHDVGHAPFSHVFERCYAPTPGCTDALLEKLAPLAGGDFNRDRVGFEPKEHEIVGAILAANVYKNEIRRLGGNPALVARMIVGVEYRYNEPRGWDRPYANYLINLLNGPAIDLDKLDYIMRDTAVAGVSSKSLDYRRLLAALSWDASFQSGIILRKTALACIGAVVDIRNHLNLWFYGHHKVVFDDYLLANAVDEVGRALNVRGFGHTLFSLDSMQGTVRAGKYRFHAPTDADVVYLLEAHRHLKACPSAEQWLSRQHMRPLWKSCAEFKRLFPGDETRRGLATEAGQTSAAQKLNGLLRKQNPKSRLKCVLCPATSNVVHIDEGAIRVEFDDGSIEPFRTVVGARQEHELPTSFFYVYVPTEAKKHRQAMLDLLKEIMLTAQ